jgi:pyruvate-formate lyase
MLQDADFTTELKFTETYRKYLKDPIAIREARCLQAQYPAILTGIIEHDLLAGRLKWPMVGFSPHNGPPNVGYGYYCANELIITTLETCNTPLSQREAVMEMLHFWQKETSQIKVENAFSERMNRYLYHHEINLLPFNYKPMVGQPIYRMGGVYVDYVKLLRLGILGLKEEVRAYRERAERAGGDVHLYEGMEIVLNVLADSCRYYYRQALDLAEKAGDPDRRKELQALAEVLHAISGRKPESFYEALQLAWLYTLISGSLELGRMDVYLGDFYARDVDSGLITEDKALALMQSLWKLINDQFREVDGRIIVGGRGRPNETNADRFVDLAMQTTRTYGRAKLPQLTLRFYRGMNPALMEKALDLIGDGYTFPLLYNDDILIESMSHAMDVSIETVEQYVPLGCGEIVLDHQGFGTPSGALNVLKALEITLHDGADPITGAQMGLKTGNLADHATFEEFYSAYKKQLVNYIEVLADQEELEYRVAAAHAPFLFLSLLYDDCLERGKAIFDGGIRYLGGSLETYGNVNAANSLVAIRETLFEKKSLSPAHLLEALEQNFAGYEHERKLLLDCPKYGNDDAFADAMMVDLHNFICNTVRDQRHRTSLDWYLNVLINNSQNTTLGRWVGATPDGRMAGAAMANANTPASGSEHNGITAMINSIVKPDTSIHAGSVQNLRFGRDTFMNERPKVKAFLDTYFLKGGSQAMITVINRGDLEKALLEPEKYQDVFVRVGGFSARFVDLPRDVQIDILSRTTY